MYTPDKTNFNTFKLTNDPTNKANILNLSDFSFLPFMKFHFLNGQDNIPNQMHQIEEKIGIEIFNPEYKGGDDGYFDLDKLGNIIKIQFCSRIHPIDHKKQFYC